MTDRPILRIGRKVRRTLYVQWGDQPSDRDRLVGLIDDAVLAAAIVSAFNEYSQERRAYFLDGFGGPSTASQHLPHKQGGVS